MRSSVPPSDAELARAIADGRAPDAERQLVERFQRRVFLCDIPASARSSRMVTVSWLTTTSSDVLGASRP